jgi:imidazolonepropionase-like amidohydrolase
MTLRTTAAALAALAWTCAPQAATLIHAGRLIDGLADRPVEAVTIVVDGNTIQSVKAGYAAPGPGDTLIDLKDATVLPGLIDTHVHLSVRYTRTMSLDVLKQTEAVRQRYKEGSDVPKIAATGGVLSLGRSGQAPQLTEEEIAAIVSTAHDYGLTVAAHAHGAEGARRAVRAGVDSIEHGTFLDDETLQLIVMKDGVVYRQ